MKRSFALKLVVHSIHELGETVRAYPTSMDDYRFLGCGVMQYATLERLLSDLRVRFDETRP